MFIYWLLVVATMPLLTDGCAPSKQHCDCHINRQRGDGCVIDSAAPQGFKCKCYEGINLFADTLYNSFCSGTPLPCRNDEACPGGRYSYCACVQGGGNCRGYPLRPSTVGSCAQANKLEASASMSSYPRQRCMCDYYDEGCRITEAAPEGFKCSCQKLGLERACTGLSIGCDEDEYCPADDYTYCGCRRGEGNCNGYPDRDRDQVCDVGNTCDCNRTTDWTKDRYSVDSVSFNTTNLIRTNPKPIRLGDVLDLPNNSEGEQTQRMPVSKTVTIESSFERTHGATVEFGIPFLTKIPLINSLIPSTTHTFTYGEKTTTSNQISHWYTCNSPPKTHTRCTVYLMSNDVTAPYTMKLKHNTIPDCVCSSYGNWKGTTSYLSKLFAEHIGPCHRVVSGECVPE